MKILSSATFLNILNIGFPGRCGNNVRIALLLNWFNALDHVFRLPKWEVLWIHAYLCVRPCVRPYVCESPFSESVHQIFS